MGDGVKWEMVVVSDGGVVSFSQGFILGLGRAGAVVKAKVKVKARVSF